MVIEKATSQQVYQPFYETHKPISNGLNSATTAVDVAKLASIHEKIKSISTRFEQVKKDKKSLEKNNQEKTETFIGNKKGIASSQNMASFFQTLYQLGNVNMDASTQQWVNQGYQLAAQADKDFFEGKFIHNKINSLSNWLSGYIVGENKSQEVVRNVVSQSLSFLITSLPSMALSFTAPASQQSSNDMTKWLKQASFWAGTISDASRIYYDLSKSINETDLKKLQEKLSDAQKNVDSLVSEQKEVLTLLQGLVENIASTQRKQKELQEEYLQ
jgi:hypothetical protein